MANPDSIVRMLEEAKDRLGQVIESTDFPKLPKDTQIEMAYSLIAQGMCILQDVVSPRCKCIHCLPSVDPRQMIKK